MQLVAFRSIQVVAVGTPLLLPLMLSMFVANLNKSITTRWTNFPWQKLAAPAGATTLTTTALGVGIFL